MFKMSEGAAIALHSMIYIANRPKDYISIKEIAQNFDISANHLSKILQRLSKAGFLESVKGPKGGFKIIPDRVSANFLNVYEAIEGEFQNFDCLFQAKKTVCSSCIMGGFVQKTNQEFRNYLIDHKISDFKL